MDRINGLPAHVLLVHIVVVFVPITAVLLVLSAFWPEARRRIGIVLPLVALFTFVMVPITTNAGEWLQAHLGFTNARVVEHAHLGDQLLPWALAMFVISAALWGAYTYFRRKGDQRPPMVISVVIMVLAVVVAIGSVVMVYRIGDSGAKAAWQGTASSSS